MNSAPQQSDVEISSFLRALVEKLPDSRDNRGKRHALAFVVAVVILALLVGKQTVSSLCRYIKNKLNWLRRMTGMPKAKSISRAHLPRILNRIDWVSLSDLITEHFGPGPNSDAPSDWVALDGKALRGTGGANRESVVLAVRHGTFEEVARARQSGAKSSEIPVVRELLRTSGLGAGKVSLDAHHCNPETTAQVAKAGGTYLMQVKGNQEVLHRVCLVRSKRFLPLAESVTVEKGHGRVTIWSSKLFNMERTKLAGRWLDSQVKTLVTVHRESLDVKSGEISNETSHYISNMPRASAHFPQLEELSTAVRQHWTVESNNWTRDVTLGEDSIRVSAGNQAQVMALMRSCALTLLRKTGCDNLKAELERLADVPGALKRVLLRFNFLGKNEVWSS